MITHEAWTALVCLELHEFFHLTTHRSRTWRPDCVSKKEGLLPWGPNGPVFRMKAVVGTLFFVLDFGFMGLARLKCGHCSIPPPLG